MRPPLHTLDQISASRPCAWLADLYRRATGLVDFQGFGHRGPGLFPCTTRATQAEKFLGGPGRSNTRPKPRAITITMLNRTSNNTQGVPSDFPLAIRPKPKNSRHGHWGRRAGPVQVRRVLDDYGLEKIEVSDPSAKQVDDEVRLYRPEDVLGWALRIATSIHVEEVPIVWARLRDASEAIQADPDQQVRGECIAHALAVEEPDKTATDAVLAHYRTALHNALRYIGGLMNNPQGQDWIAIENWKNHVRLKTKKVEAEYALGDGCEDGEGEGL